MLTLTTNQKLELVLQAARKRARAVKFSNDDLIGYVIGHVAGRRLSEIKVCQFAAQFKPIFADFEIDRLNNGKMSLTLYLNNKDDATPAMKIIHAWIKSDSNVSNEFGIN
jgi:hypothetical protein